VGVTAGAYKNLMGLSTAGLILTVVDGAYSLVGTVISSSPVDISFSLECRSLESQPNSDILLPWNTAVTDYESDPSKQKMVAEGHWGVAHYDTGV
jgi:hypothetical protein